ncbi:family 43 glycosylhydrolase [Undibacterium sp. TC4M20W]|uniref:family 43 glycosylhydrolase n=1 Tax=Undibacterium sp. TC4M20W TaxID=3413052 RepID=UPI003BF3FA4D
MTSHAKCGIVFLSLIWTVLISVPGLSFAQPVFNNPLVKNRADPQIFLHTDGYYYFTATAPEYDRIELRRARSINELATADAKVIWRKHSSGPMSHHIWAPELHFIDGKWYVYFTAGRADAIWDIRLYVLESSAANPVDGEWLERGQLKTGWESFSLDATTFSHAGQRYLVWTQRDPAPDKKNTNIYLAKMETPLSIARPATLLSRPDYDWEKRKYEVNEAPAVLIRNGRIFITYSASATDENYCMGLLTAPANANLLDAKVWSKSSQPVFKSNAASNQYGPGHNSFTTTADGKTDVLVYHARDYRDIKGNALNDPNRHTRAQTFSWNADGTPDFGQPGAPMINQGKLAAKPLFRDPIMDGAADPVLVRNTTLGKWWMFYTNRRANANDVPGVAWVHGTRIGIAESDDEGANWHYIGEADIALPPSMGGIESTHWAPDIIRADDGTYHMFLTVVSGIFNDWKHPRYMVHLRSQDLRHWRNARVLQLASDRAIDATVLRLLEGGYRMWYNNEVDKKSIYYADSTDLENWIDKGKAVGDQSGEGPKVFYWKEQWWMITDVWRGLAVYRSDDLLSWKRQVSGNLLEIPGHGEDDGVIGGHPDVVVNGDRAFLFYFTHPGKHGADQKKDGKEQRRSSLQVVELLLIEQGLQADRDAPAYVRLSND